MIDAEKITRKWNYLIDAEKLTRKWNYLIDAEKLTRNGFSDIAWYLQGGVGGWFQNLDLGFWLQVQINTSNDPCDHGLLRNFWIQFQRLV